MSTNDKYEAFITQKIASIKKRKEEVSATIKTKTASLQEQLDKKVAELKGQMERKVAPEREELTFLNRELAIYSAIVNSVENGEAPVVEPPKKLHWTQRAKLANQ
jgi:hypothetical protein